MTLWTGIKQQPYEVHQRHIQEQQQERQDTHIEAEQINPCYVSAYVATPHTAASILDLSTEGCPLQ